MRSFTKREKKIEEWSMCSVLIKYCIFDGHQGHFATMALYGIIQINRIDRNFNIKIDSIFWNSYRTTSGDCCSSSEKITCTIPCDFYFYLIFTVGEITSNPIIGNTEKQGYYGFVFAFNFIEIQMQEVQNFN
ncbi:hypothetical protein HZS_5852 [Henneguya salminicola]|nr:hypothetical protein HZS_5852 [Henneguya salminicola]